MLVEGKFNDDDVGGDFESFKDLIIDMISMTRYFDIRDFILLTLHASHTDILI